MIKNHRPFYCVDYVTILEPFEQSVDNETIPKKRCLTTFINA